VTNLRDAGAFPFDVVPISLAFHDTPRHFTCSFCSIVAGFWQLLGEKIMKPVGRQNLFYGRPLIPQTDDRRLVSPC
jgi:hypothetical protein